MGSDASTTPRRRGRPPAAKSSKTRGAILDGARVLFAERGYGAVTNKDLAAAAGVTTGALYHYVESKLDLYVAVHDDMRQRIYRQFQLAEASESTFLGKLGAVLEAARELNLEDPSLARFVGAVRADLRRYPEVLERLGGMHGELEQFFMNMVDSGVATGEIRRDDVVQVEEFVRLILIGLTEHTSHSPERQARAIDGIMGVMRGTLIHPVESPDANC